MSSWLITHVRGVLDWIDKLPAGRQTLATGLIVAAAGGIAWVLWLLVTSVAEFISSTITRNWHSIRDAKAQRIQRLKPQRRIALVDTGEAETKAVETFHRVVAHMGTAGDAFKQRCESWSKQVEQLKGRKLPRQVLDKGMNDGTRVLERFTADIKADVKQFRKSAITLRDSWSSRMYWHDQRQSASDILSSENPLLIDELLQKNNEAKAIYVQQKETVGGWEGYTDRMDRAVRNHQNVLDDLIEGFDAFGGVCESIIHFRRQRLGWRGYLRRRLTRKR